MQHLLAFRTIIKGFDRQHNNLLVILPCFMLCELHLACYLTLYLAWRKIRKIVDFCVRRCGLVSIFPDRTTIATAIFPVRSLFLPAVRAILQVCHAEGVDDYGQICPEGQAEQEGSEGTEPPAANNVGLQSSQQSC